MASTSAAFSVVRYRGFSIGILIYKVCRARCLLFCRLWIFSQLVQQLDQLEFTLYLPSRDHLLFQGQLDLVSAPGKDYDSINGRDATGFRTGRNP